jgi:hypothetical protein
MLKTRTAVPAAVRKWLQEIIISIFDFISVGYLSRQALNPAAKRLQKI